MTAPEIVRQLVERFEQHCETYRAAKYNETQLRNEFLNPFFEALGWDVLNKLGYSEENKHVIHEDSLDIEGAKKAPDYAFKIGRERKFFVEAKKPFVKIETNPEVAFQLKRYVWSAKLPLGILTDFEEFAVYECRSKPKVTDSVKSGRVMLLSYTDYIEKWDELVSIFSYNAVMTGGFDKFANTAAKKKGTAEIDSAFLSEIEGWRDALAKNIALRNKSRTGAEQGRSIQSEADLNYAVQMTIDRMIFLRICEDRGYEAELQLQDISKRENIYAELKKLFEKADRRYNSGLFHFKKEDGRGRADTFTTGLEIDDKALKDIIKDLYYPSPYVFALIPADILGQIYEQFLGKVIRLTAGGNAKVEEKPEVRKAGGVYYTPTFIVDYIVINTLGKLLEGKTPAQAALLKLVDPACGSGTFLLGAYQYLLDWHLNWYVNNEPEKWSKGKNAPLLHFRSLKMGVDRGGGGWKLTVAKKKEILLNNIYGVDIDPQAVEVTKLSLLLKVIEDPGQLSLLDERILPDLGKNIQCGNSLIGSDYFEGQLMVTEEERAKVNAFDWKAAFPEVFASSGGKGDSHLKDDCHLAGGFDAVIGNPPYVDIKSLPNDEVRFLFSRYYSANNRINLFAIFIEKVFEIINPKTFQFSMIIPTALLTQESYKKLRQTVLEKYQIENITRLPNESFGSSAGEVKVDTAIFVFSNQKTEHNKVEIIAYEGYSRINKIDSADAKIHGFVAQSEWRENDDNVWTINIFNNEDVIIRKIEINSVSLEDCADFALGITPYDKYKGHTPSQIENQVFHSDRKKDETFRKLLAGNDVRRYSVQWNGEKWISYGDGLGAPREKRFFTQKRILVKQIIDWTTKRIWATITDEELYNTQNAFNLLAKSELSIEYLLGILNSKLMTFYHQKKFLDEFKMRFQKILIKDAKRFPIRSINFNDAAEVARHDKMVSLVERMLSLHKSLASTKNPQETDRLTREVEAVDKSIDELVYQLYGLTEEEIKIVKSK